MLFRSRTLALTPVGDTFGLANKELLRHRMRLLEFVATGQIVDVGVTSETISHIYERAYQEVSLLNGGAMDRPYLELFESLRGPSAQEGFNNIIKVSNSYTLVKCNYLLR